MAETRGVSRDPDAIVQRGLLALATTTSPTTLRIAVFHRSEDVHEHVAPLKSVKDVELLLIWQGVTWIRPRNLDGLLWELSPEDSSDSRIRDLIEGTASASYSLASNPSLIQLSRSMGFRRHLSTPIRLV